VVAFTNIARHLRPGGRLGFACWQTRDLNPWFVGPVLAPFVAAPRPLAPDKSPTGPFALGDPDRVRHILREAGFGGIRINVRAHEVDVPESAVTDDAQLAFMGVGADMMDDARQAVASQLGRFATDDGGTDSHWRSKSSPRTSSCTCSASGRPVEESGILVARDPGQ
jgi:hypothetical protein